MRSKRRSWAESRSASTSRALREPSVVVGRSRRGDDEMQPRRPNLLAQCPPFAGDAAASAPRTRPHHTVPVRLLVIGGTVFLGRAVAEAALARGHVVTLFHRGRHGAELFPEAEHLLGDRTRDLGPLAGREWDAVIDTCGFEPEHVGAAARLLAD